MKSQNITTLSGYEGAGKTTILQRIQSQHNVFIVPEVARLLIPLKNTLLAEYRKLDSFIQDAEKMLTAIAEGLDAKVNNKKLDYSVGNRFERIMRSVEYGW